MHYFIGWDVGAWHCDKNENSRDALAVLQATENGTLRTVGSVWRNNLREAINEHGELRSIVNACCNTSIGIDDRITIAIDTPLGLTQAVGRLVQGTCHQGNVPDDNTKNPYLFRQTEQWLLDKGYTPLSAITHMIGSQATKGMHLLRKFQLNSLECGIWSSGGVTAIETYPAPCKVSQRLTRLFSSLNQSFVTQDRVDAVYCGLVAYLFATDRNSLVSPVDNPPLDEGWIWIPADVIAGEEP